MNTNVDLKEIPNLMKLPVVQYGVPSIFILGMLVQATIGLNGILILGGIFLIMKYLKQKEKP